MIPKPLTKKQISHIRIGEWIRVYYDDAGMQDVVALELGRYVIKDKSSYMPIFNPNTEETSSIDLDQIYKRSMVVVIPPVF